MGGDLVAEKLSLRMRFRLQRTLLNQQKIRFSFPFLTFVLRSEFISTVCYQFGPRLFSVVCHVVCHSNMAAVRDSVKENLDITWKDQETAGKMRSL